MVPAPDQQLAHHRGSINMYKKKKKKKKDEPLGKVFIGKWSCYVTATEEHCRAVCWEVVVENAIGAQCLWGRSHAGLQRLLENWRVDLGKFWSSVSPLMTPSMLPGQLSVLLAV